MADLVKNRGKRMDRNSRVCFYRAALKRSGFSNAGFVSGFIDINNCLTATEVEALFNAEIKGRVDKVCQERDIEDSLFWTIESITAI